MGSTPNSKFNLVSSEFTLVSIEFSLETKPAKPAARAGANHAGATAIPSACQALSSIKLDMKSILPLAAPACSATIAA